METVLLKLLFKTTSSAEGKEVDVLLEKVEQEGKTKGWTEGRYGENMLLELFHSLLKRESTVHILGESCWRFNNSYRTGTGNFHYYNY